MTSYCVRKTKVAISIAVFHYEDENDVYIDFTHVATLSIRDMLRGDHNSRANTDSMIKTTPLKQPKLPDPTTCRVHTVAISLGFTFKVQWRSTTLLGDGMVSPEYSVPTGAKGESQSSEEACLL